jgi:hypothetical protein
MVMGLKTLVVFLGIAELFFLSIIIGEISLP